ncbi:hypothetical protein SA496_22345 [Pseudomonas sp. JS3066]|jgi:hypothetical protein|uniref:hypothetical protein n=1 Tax=unclassified Pseudomonas TaxID=196821 RepID=UPI000EA90AF2|nr:MULTISPECIES: hypothetical protein [unclassified Pseudomonas]AYF90002.1 hypothetical protein D6Z43_23690 [Pseudomonas sp. DY-1]MDH4652086.1 hypothetical protein [Pseudomonas sp. BN606]MRK22556.1 hypothetical protein [Pseudomonas sp. JG-B]WVK92425.1 hypothetical protein SA496_22345 [Pseudomonas sp. JS3066]
MSSERSSDTRRRESKTLADFPRWLVDPDYVDLVLERDPDDPLFDPTLDDAETFRHSHHG